MLIFLALFVPVAILALTSVFSWRPDRDVLGPPMLWGLSALELAAAFVLLVAVLRETIPGRASSLALLGWAAAGGGALHVAVTLATFARSPVEPASGQARTVGLYCYAFEVMLAIPCVLFAFWLARRGLTSRPWRLGLLGGVGAGLAADAVWRLLCPYSNPGHAFSSHSLGITSVAVAGLALAAVWEMVRARSWRRAGSRR